MPLVESSGLRHQDVHAINTEEETEAYILELAMEKQEESSDPCHIKEPEPKHLKTIGPTMALAERSGLRYQDVHVRDTEEETEADILELAMKKREESSDPSHIKEPEPKHLKTIGPRMALMESSGLRYQDTHGRNLEEETNK